MFDLGFTLSDDSETQRHYGDITKSKTLKKDLDSAVIGATLLANYKYFEAFAGSGIGGLALDKYGAKNIGYSENDPYAIKNYSANFPGRVNFGDITKIDGNDLPNFDILIGGSPCQDFSDMRRIWVEGRKTEGLNGSKSRLLFDYGRVLNSKKPKWFILENVQGLLKSNGGGDFDIIKEMFEENYNIKWEVLNTSDYGIPQTRRRVYIVGQRKDLGDFNFSFPKKIPLNLTAQDLLEHSVSEKYFLSKKMKAYVLKEGTKNFKQKPETDLKIARPLMASMGKGHRAGTDNYHRCKTHPLGKTNLRKLTPAECARLQGLDDNYKFVVSDTQAYRLMGNAMSYNVVSRLVYKLGLYIKRQLGLDYNMVF